MASFWRQLGQHVVTGICHHAPLPCCFLDSQGGVFAPEEGDRLVISALKPRFHAPLHSCRFYQSGASFLFPDAWDKYLEVIPAEEHGDLVAAYHSRLTSPDPEVQVRAAKAWSIWEGSTSKLFLDPQFIQKFSGDSFALAFARIESHYFFNRGFFESDGWLLDNIHKVRGIPCAIVQGRYDVVCPMTSAWDLKKAFPEAELRVVPDAGHSAQEPGIISELVYFTNKFRELEY
jgi:proline iminopeptidase